MVADQDISRTTLCDEEKLKDLSDIEPQEHQASWPLRLLKRHGKILIACTAIVILTPIVYFSIVGLPGVHVRYNQCGTSADEARARGCVFETTGFSWVTKECYDPATEEDFMKHILDNNIKYYRDWNYTIEVSMEEARLGNGEGFYVHQEYHVAHCMFLIEKLHRSLMHGKPVDGYTMPFTHTKHCIKQSLLPPGARKDDHQASYTKWPYCGKPGGFNVDWRKPRQWTN